MEPYARLDVAHDSAWLDRITQLLENYCSECQLPGEIAFDLQLVAEEILVNTIDYGFSDSGGSAPERLLELALYHEPESVTLKFTDNARAFNPLAQAPPELGLPAQDAPIGGLGVHLVKSLTDQQHYRRQGNRNILTLKVEFSSRIT